MNGGYGATAARRIPDPKVGGSNPSSLTFDDPPPTGWFRPETRLEDHLGSLYSRAFLAQMVERWPFKPMVVGSIPTEGASADLA